MLTRSRPWLDAHIADAGRGGKRRRLLRWSVGGAVLGALLSLLAFAPASWLARGIDQASAGRLLLADARGSIWAGSGLLVLSAGRGSHDASALPGRMAWRTELSRQGLLVHLSQPCCLNGEVSLQLQPGLGSAKLSLAAAQLPWIARWPSAWLGGLGTPWNTLQLEGSVRLSAQQLSLEWALGRWRQAGQLHFDIVNLSSRVATVEPLGSYRFSISGDASRPGVNRLQLSTLEGALMLNGEGTFDNGRVHFQGVAKAAPARETALDNLLNIIGRRQGAQSLISIG